MKVHMNRLTKMLNQILDVNNMEDKSRSLEVVADFPIGEKMGNMIKNILPVAASQSITVKCEGLDSDLRVPVDVDKFETIFSNLLSNALKYTSGDSMEMNISLSHNGSGAAVVEVFNNCSAIPEEEIGKLFDRFYQMKRRSKDKRIAGTGIGLHYSKALAEIHHGTLTASYDDSLRGITFRLSLPDSIEAYAEEEILSDSAHLTIMEDTETILQADNEADVVNKYSESKANVMVIDDDVDIANYLKLLLSDYYNVTCFYRAEEAVEEFNRNHLPDIVLSDVIMSGMDGINLCKYIKDNDLTCHIPVILVTAKVDEENKVNGLDSGADAYVTKPFEPAYLVSLVRSLLKNRNLSRGTFAQISEILSLDTGILSEEDKTFLNDLAGILEKEISNPDLDIPTISSGLNVSRSKLFYRIKGLTGMSPLELLKTYRLKLAAKLLKEGKYNVSEVSEIVGFSSLSYFSTVFKKEFGITPKDAKK